jgi:ferredoxin
MPHVIAEACIGVKDKSCVAVCPVECIYEAEQQMYVDPVECIDCGACLEECPVGAIFAEDDVPEQWRTYVRVNATLAAGRSPGA